MSSHNPSGAVPNLLHLLHLTHLTIIFCRSNAKVNATQSGKRAKKIMKTSEIKGKIGENIDLR